MGMTEDRPDLTREIRIRPSLIVSFLRSHVSSAVATAADFALLFGLVELLGVWYVTATAAGAGLGAVVNFVMNRQWSFEATDGAWQGQALRYGLVSSASLLLNALGAWVFTEKFGFPYGASVAIAAFLVGTFFNYPLHRSFVYSTSVRAKPA